MTPTFLTRPLLAAACALALTACTQSQAPVSFIAEGNPEKLSDWHLMAVAGGKLQLNKDVVPYDLNTPLFTDYAHKLRTVWMPKGQAAVYHADSTFDFPVGSIISKTFYYPKGADGKTVLATSDNGGDKLDLASVRLIETRLLVRRASGWIALPYVWNAGQTEAVLSRTGDQIPLEVVHEDKRSARLTYVVPNVNQCASCHVADVKSRQFQPIGPKARHLNRDYTYDGVSVNQLDHLARVGYLTGMPANGAGAAPRNANWRDGTQSVEARARAYLDINCAHCHNDKGAANTTALHLQMGAPADLHLGLCKPPVAAGAGTGGRSHDIAPGRPDDSIMLYRLDSAEPGIMMPELGRGSVHKEGVALIRAWIAAMKQGCDGRT
ncbi:putative repeat protein (TIGR03806 family) [Duganella sp. SG902]|uniref:SO2930 family diheme c-type cytochrome n=1 Tax=Duganella sp. SG902 TaxID=2587016 RepID=UPI00159DBDFC|nr:SO2930 family diheme c-type cytochrome [Duganella sp. SG902]NVM76127.1 putative repeat protein (TIGR03806 family) [Duganella sp. SG902]